MVSNKVARWGLPVGVALAAAAALLVWLASLLGGNPLRQVVLVLAILLAGMAMATVIWAAFARLHNDKTRDGIARYACPSCGYAPDPPDMEKAPAKACSKCGRPVYEH